MPQERSYQELAKSYAMRNQKKEMLSVADVYMEMMWREAWLMWRKETLMEQIDDALVYGDRKKFARLSKQFQQLVIEFG